MEESGKSKVDYEAKLDFLFGTYEEIEAQNAERERIYPEFRHHQIEQAPRTAPSARVRSAAAIIRRVSRLNEGGQSD